MTMTMDDYDAVVEDIQRRLNRLEGHMLETQAMTQPNDEYQLSDTDRINYLESSVASFNHMVVLLNERLDALEAAQPSKEAPILTGAAPAHIHDLSAVYDHIQDLRDENTNLRRNVQHIQTLVMEAAQPSKEAPVVTGPLPSRTYMDQIKKSLKIIEKECDILKHLWRQP